MLFLFFISILLSFFISFVVTPFVKQFFIKQNWVEDPVKKNQKVHNATASSTVPRGGGVPIFLAVFFTIILLSGRDKHTVGILAASVLTLVVGLIDDIFDISPKFRLFTNVLVALIIVASGIGIAYISNPLGGVIDLSSFQLNFNFLGQHSIWIISDLLALFWIVGFMNVVGWSAGVEGQLPGFVAISSIFIGLVGLRFSQDSNQLSVIILAGALAGSFLGFLPYNFFPQQIMPGYSGKSLAGLLLAVLGILSGAKLATIILLLGIPIIDAFFVIIKRILSRRSPLVGGPDHLHHYLLKIGWTKPQISILYMFFSLVLGTLSLFLNSNQKFYTFIGLFVLFLAFSLKVSRHI
ncbi:undecaprenyl/decaprenyl-phosphate alpha-N-acetylglucosaminyl 1-phosphate transferase [Candidatus Shapirobacteria bacterium]|nr:undecaprenyl/decaprenyl-phosphate alpha-N-acetylglucosaminyl 1-phosphate transferase [Candidatus Shapirobacteria bacterium]